MRISIAIALMATLSIAGASGAEIGRSISDWMWPLSGDNYPLLQEAASVPMHSVVEPQEEGRRRSDKRFETKNNINKGVYTSISISKNKKGPKQGSSGHNTPIRPTNGAPIYIAGYHRPKPGSASEPVHVVVEDSSSSWGWGWIQGIIKNWRDDGHHHHFLQQQQQQEQQQPGGSESDTGIVSVSYGQAPDSYYEDHQDSSIYNPFTGWWSRPSHSEIASPSEEDPQPLDEPSTSEVMVIRYPEFIKTIGQGISKMTNAMKHLGQGMTNSFTKGLTDTSAGIGTGVASIIPLEEIGNSHHNKGGGQASQPSQQSDLAKPSSSSPSGGSTSSVYVDKHTSVQQAPSQSQQNNWFPNPIKWFGSGSDDSESDGSTSTIYVERPKIGSRLR